MKDSPPNRRKRIVFIPSGAIDSLIGAVILLIGFGVVPIDITDYGLQI